MINQPIIRLLMAVTVGFLLHSCNELPDDIRMPEESDSFTYLTTGLTDRNVLVIFEDRSGTIWAGTGDGVGRLNGDKFTLLNSGDGLISGPIKAIAQTDDGNLWFGGANGISIYDGASFQNLEVSNVTALLADSRGTVWVGLDNGLYRIQSNGQILFYNDANCSSCNYFDEIHEDSSKNVWFATWGGVLRFNGTQFSSFDSSNGLEDDYVQAIGEDHLGRIWFGHYLTDQISIYRNGSFSTETNPGASSDLLALAPNGKNMFIGTWGGGVLLHDGVIIQPLALPKSDEFINHILSDSKGNVWIGTSKNGLIRHLPKQSL